MIIAANQPYFAPYPGFFAKAFLADVLVILDDVQFPQGTTWTSRNRFKNDQGELWLTIPVWKKGLGKQPINRVRICYEGRWLRKHLESLETAYRNAPYLEDHLGFLEELFAARFDRLLDLNLAMIRYLLDCLQIHTRLVLLSELGVTARGSQLLIALCQVLGARSFLSQSRARKYLDPGLFQQGGIELCSVRYVPSVYPQLWGEFLANLSALDLVLNCGPKAKDILLRHQRF